MARHPFDAALTGDTLPAEPEQRLAAVRRAAKRQAHMAVTRTPAERARREARALRLLWARWWKPYEALSARDRQTAVALALGGPAIRLINHPEHGPWLQQAYASVGGTVGWIGVLRALAEPTGHPGASLGAGVLESLLLFFRWRFTLARCVEGHWYARHARGRASDACPQHGRQRAVRDWLARDRQRRQAFRQAHPRACALLDKFYREAKTLYQRMHRREYPEAWYRERVEKAAKACAAALRETHDGTPREWVAFFGIRSSLLGPTLARALGLPTRRR